MIKLNNEVLQQFEKSGLSINEGIVVDAMRIKNKKILAFIHIEKAAGQTLTRILENNYTYKHCRVTPLKKEHQGIFTADAMRTILRINPFVEAISGHSIKPFSDLEITIPKVRYITLMRNPEERYISHYQYWVKRMKKNIRFEEFLELESMCNFQTMKIAGGPNLEKAKRILRKNIFLAGTVEEFDAFLIVLKAKISPINLECVYTRKNIAKNTEIKRFINNNRMKYRDKIIENNLLDIELYHFVKDELFKKEKKALSISHESLMLNKKGKTTFQIKNEFIGKLYRNFFFSPMIKMLRFKNGLDMSGSY